MKTDDLITMLACGEDATDPNVLARSYALALGWGILGATLLMIFTLGVRPDLADALRLPMFWVKFVFVATIAAAGLMVATRVSRPGVPLGLSPLVLAAPVIVIWGLAIGTLTGPTADPAGEIFGEAWYLCPLFIVALAVPVFVAVLWAMKGLAPTNLRLAGAAAGVLAAGVSATIYSFHCTEMAASFLGVWYVLGISIPAALGAAIGPSVLKW